MFLVAAVVVVKFCGCNANIVGNAENAVRVNAGVAEEGVWQRIDQGRAVWHRCC